MTRVAVEIPKIGLVMENARVVRWLKNVGDRVEHGEPLLELETEKSVVEIESTASGRLVQILLGVDQEARVGDRVAWLENDTGVSHASQPERIVSSPVARRLAATHAADLRQITGTGPRGRIQLKDVQQAIEARSGSDATAVAASGSAGPMSAMRRAVARSMTLSNATVPQFSVERAVDWTSIHARRAKTPADAPTPSINDFILQATAQALLAFSGLNTMFSGDAHSPNAGIVRVRGAHIGLVVAVEDGLLVPVLHGVERLGLEELMRQRRAIVERACSGTLKREELEGATISISNLGTRGPDRFNALINPPQSAILAVGRQQDRVVALRGGIEVRPLSQLTLTVDHRVADGRLAADFLAFLVEILEGDTWRMD